MTLKIFHTSDNHIGMNYNKYPDLVRKSLIEMRISSLEKMVDIANQRACQLFVIAGDLFNSLNVSEKTIARVTSILSKFESGLVLVLPGNHDYYTGNEKLWDLFLKKMADNTILLREFKVYSFDIGDDRVNVYPAFCNSKHGEKNNLDWIKSSNIIDDGSYNLGIGHGAIEGLSLDQEGKYFSMSMDELLSIPLDIWLLGHTHVPYPLDDKVINCKVFNAGTHEPDGMNYKFQGSAFLIEIDQEKNIKAERIRTGSLRFCDKTLSLKYDDDLMEILNKDLQLSQNLLLRLRLSGYQELEVYKNRNEVYKEIESKVLYLDLIDGDLKPKLKKEEMLETYPDESLAYLLLKELEDDEDSMYLAYELIEESRN